MTIPYEFTNRDIFNNILLLSDSYKYSHWKQYPEGTNVVYSYLESRGSVKDKHGDTVYTETVFFGLKYIIERYLSGVVVTDAKIREAKAIIDAHMGPGVFNEDGWRYILDTYKGRLPVVIKAVPEGTVVPTGNVLMTIENTGGPKTAWLTNFLETVLTHVWSSTSVATNSREIKKICKKYNELTSDAPVDSIDFQVHDFGFRGVSSVETSGLNGAAHLVSFKGTDTVSAITLLKNVYAAIEMPAFSIPATEHSTMTSWGREFEVNAIENMLDKFPTGIIACVGDSYDIMDFVRDKVGTTLKNKVLSREGTLVVRPDSGDPVITTERIIYALWDKFGGTTNSKGFKVLDPHIRMIQGDGVDREMIRKILDNFKNHGFSSENIAFGSGGGLLQMFNRDTLKFAFKCSYIEVDGKPIDVRKYPMEFDSDGNYGPSFKRSKAGRLDLVKTVDGTFMTLSEDNVVNGQLKTVFSDGYYIGSGNSLDKIRERASI